MRLTEAAADGGRSATEARATLGARHDGPMSNPPLQFAGTVVNAADPDALATFYEALLGWPRIMNEPDWVALRHPEGGTAIAFQRAENVSAPSWPTRQGHQQATIHLDFTTGDLATAVAHAVDCGATVSGAPIEREQVLIDPAGNPFCLIERQP